MKTKNITTMTGSVPFAALLGVAFTLSAHACPASVPISTDHVVNMRDFGAIPEQGPALNVTPLLDCALNFTRANGLRAIYFPSGHYTFNTPVQAIDLPITVFGDGKGRSYLLRNFVADNAHIGLLTIIAGANSASVRDLGILALPNTAHGAAISLVASATDSPSFTLFSNLYLSAETGGNWDYTVSVDGTAKTSEPVGVRDVDFQDCSVFGAANGAILLDGVVGFNFIGGGVFQAGGNANTLGLISVSPSYNGAPGVPSYYTNINTTYVAGITMQASRHGHYSAYFPFPITTTSFSFDNIVIGHAEGGVQNFWQKSAYIDPEQ